MTWTRYIPKTADYSNLDFIDVYPIDNLIDDIARYWMEYTDDSGHPAPSSYDSKRTGEIFFTFKQEIRRIIESNIAGGTLKVIHPEKYDVTSITKPSIKLAEFAVWAVENKLNCPNQILKMAPTQNPIAEISENTTTKCSDPQALYESAYEDIMSDETILRLMELPLPRMKQQLAILAADKKKSDAAIMAAAKIGLMFYEERLPKPTTEKLFVSEYKKYLDKLPELPETTIKRIYKNLPEGYRASRDGGKVASEQTDITPIIKAAAFAGSMAYERDSMNITALKKSLSLEQYVIPSDDILKEIIAAVKKLELEVDE